MADDASSNPPRWKPWRAAQRRRATLTDEAAQYAHNPSFTDHLPWVEYLEDEQCFLLDDNRSVGAVFELQPIGTEGREPDWLMAARDALEDALQDSFDELDQAPWVVQFFCQDDCDFAPYLERLERYIAPRARGTPFTQAFFTSMQRHLDAIAKPGGLFDDQVVSHLPWRGSNRRIRLVVYRWLGGQGDEDGQSPTQLLSRTCDRLVASLQACGVNPSTVERPRLLRLVAPLVQPFSSPHRRISRGVLSTRALSGDGRRRGAAAAIRPRFC